MGPGKRSQSYKGKCTTSQPTGSPFRNPLLLCVASQSFSPTAPELSRGAAPERREEAEKEAEEEVPAPKLPAKFPAKKFPFKKKSAAPATAAIETEEEEDSAPEQVELLPEIETIEEGVAEEEAEGEDTAPPTLTPAGPPSSPPSRLGGVKRPAKGMTGFAKKGSPFKKMPKFKKP